ncbi:hypothetical protein HMN09_01348900 [Mycena chlorophos]|uniref:DUF6534 domain-containing protein n=1 Tax=Mycena chlorophos TaxID=658473 RepID=A0A8H6RY40_MYCCL|nr:hypothetical protein HMN09_01348900 [Mycena chlorophos]
MASSALLPTYISLNGTLGAYLVGVLCSVMLFGVVTNQYYLYMGRFPADGQGLKILVASVWFCELAHVICITHSLYGLVLTDFGQPQLITSIPVSITISAVFNAIVAMCVQGYFAFRIYRLSKSLFIPFVSWILSLLFLASSSAICVIGMENIPLAAFEKQWGWLLDTTWFIAAINDMLIAVTLVVLFHQWHQRDTENWNVALIDKLIAWTIETGIITSAAGVLNLLCFAFMKSNFVWIAWYVITARLYSNSFLANLNSRETLRTINLANSTRPSRPPSPMAKLPWAATPIPSSPSPSPSRFGSETWSSDLESASTAYSHRTGSHSARPSRSHTDSEDNNRDSVIIENIPAGISNWDTASTLRLSDSSSVRFAPADIPSPAKAVHAQMLQPGNPMLRFGGRSASQTGFDLVSRT